MELTGRMWVGVGVGAGVEAGVGQSTAMPLIALKSVERIGMLAYGSRATYHGVDTTAKVATLWSQYEATYL